MTDLKRLDVSGIQTSHSTGNLLHLKPFVFNYTFGTGTHFYTHVDKEQAKIIHDTYIILPDPRTKEYIPHLYLNSNDHDYWYSRIILYPDNPIRTRLPKPARLSHKNIDKAAMIAARRVKEIIVGHRSEDQKERLFEWLDFIRERARIIWVSVPDENAAYI